jgi:predicted DNA-binding ribbon-helix-helix protein
MAAEKLSVERVQTGIRVEKRLLKVLKALAEYKDLTLGDLIEGIALHALEGKAPFSAATLAHVRDLRRIYGLELRAADSHRLRERSGRTP